MKLRFLKRLRYVFLLILISLTIASGRRPEVSLKDYTIQREEMVKFQIEARGITDDKVLQAMRKVPRHLYVPEREIRKLRSDTYPKVCVRINLQKSFEISSSF